MGFVKAGDALLNEDYIERIDASRLEVFILSVHLRSGLELELHGQPALDLVMQTNPALLEGRRMMFARHAWAFHNLIAHPLLQILAWFGCAKLGFRIHDMTVPNPKPRV